ncbi:hypothetical protein H2200_003454 [Cladophialophora chaetospira]|uniref:Cylicin I n=1 Tax=Cladophialophora chaetospira TaxID=386627 RepID=A0AA38XHI4_9EURO|nr:hypothetical protein H2200_003454 [Cladophialophora chaetospira]
MPLPRPTALRGSIRSFSLKRAGTQARATLRGVGRRTYASEHGAQKSSDIPWLIGSIVVTVPAAGWLWQQGPTKSDHGHGHDAHTEEEHEDAPAEESKEEGGEEPKEEESGKEDDSGKEDESGDKEEDKQDESKDEDKDDSGREGKDKEVSGKGKALPESESKEEKDSQGDLSGSNHPAMTRPQQQKKPEGPPATAKLHGTVDKSQRPEEPQDEKRGDSGEK